MSAAVPADEAKRIANRLRRAQGQLAAVLTMVEEGRDCRDVITQLSAVSSAIDRAGFAIIASAMRDCLREDDVAAGEEAESSADRAVRMADLEKMFLSLA
ncbi:metal-sensitive transcriptional regulator [Microcella flavibacter]|uniref:metal-sensitive transcriptional regulator n=1 Tax=Microcella flavibacter TaxID=1804990 RepID=UPI001456FB62|nr:metal-sensitive transcriptional regulator [Microcella flavibacter]